MSAASTNLDNVSAYASTRVFAGTRKITDPKKLAATHERVARALSKVAERNEKTLPKP